MPTILSHPAVAIGFLPWFKNNGFTPRVLFIGVLLTILPDLDVIGLWMGVPYSHMLGHRGLSHSIPFAIILAGVIARIVTRDVDIKPIVLWLYFSLCMVSHGLLDAVTNGGLGIAFFAPFSGERYFFNFHPIEVSALAPSRFVTERMLNVLVSEIIWVWLPFSLLVISGLAVDRFRRRRK
jgi:inner membrane protein